MKRLITWFLGLMLSLVLLMVDVYAQETAQKKDNFNVDKAGVIIDGYDVVSYLIDSPVKGKIEFKADFKGIEYWFSSNENLEIFLKNPEKFEPAYGGWCAYAMGDSGEKVKIDPKTYKIIDGQLFLFYNFYFNNTIIDWNKDENRLREKANENWAKIID